MRRPTKERRHLSGQQSMQGFTLIELIVVVLILGLLAGLVVPRLFRHVTQAKITVTKAQISAFQTALGAYKLDTGNFPSTDQGLQALNTPARCQQLERPLSSQGHSHGPLGPTLYLQVSWGTWR